MPQTLLLTGDVNLMNVDDPKVPFRRVISNFKAADFIFSNLECCFYVPPADHSVENEGFYAAPSTAKALKIAGIHGVGVANNVNYGEAAIKSSLKRLDELGIPHTGAGINRDAAYAPIILERAGLRIGFLQRTSVYWQTNHEARTNSTGVAVIRGHTSYHVPHHKTRLEIPPANRPGVPPEIITWADPQHLQQFKDDIVELRARCDIVVASCHWGLFKDVLHYMPEIAHAAVDAGADVVFGHGPHYSLPVESYKGKPIYYGLGSFSFHTGHHGGVAPGQWVGMLAKITLQDRAVTGASFRFVRNNEANETVTCTMVEQQSTFDDIQKRSKLYGAVLSVQGDEAILVLRP